MNMKLKAVLQTIAFFVVCLSFAIVANLVPTYVLGIIVFAGLFYLIYTLLLQRLEIDNKIKELNTK